MTVVVKEQRNRVVIDDENNVKVYVREPPHVVVTEVGIRGFPGGPGPIGPPGAAGTGGRYEHDQALSSATWTVLHNLGAIPSAVAVVDTAGTLVHGEVHHVDTNTMQLIFSAPFSGKAYVGT